jgi:hypothetical protein
MQKEKKNQEREIKPSTDNTIKTRKKNKIILEIKQSSSMTCTATPNIFLAQSIGNGISMHILTN